MKKSLKQILLDHWKEKGGFIVLINKAEQPVYEQPTYESNSFVRKV